jgi:hypothetical protein
VIFGFVEGRVYSLLLFFVKSMRQFSQIFRGQDNYKILESQRVFLGYGFWVDVVLKYETRLCWILFEEKKKN